MATATSTSTYLIAPLKFWKFLRTRERNVKKDSVKTLPMDEKNIRQSLDVAKLSSSIDCSIGITNVPSLTVFWSRSADCPPALDKNMCSQSRRSIAKNQLRLQREVDGYSITALTRVDSKDATGGGLFP